MTSKFFVKTTESTSIINGDTMTIHGDYIMIYKGDELYGIFRQENIIDAHRTDKESS